MEHLLSLIPASNIEWTIGFFIGIVILGCIIGMLTGFFGVGGGFLLTPALNIIFGIPYDTAVGSGLLQIFCTSSVSARKHYQKGNVDIRLGLVMAITAMIGADVGKRLMDFIKGGEGAAQKVVVIMGREHELLKLVMDGLFLFLISAVMISMLMETRSSKKAEAEDDSNGNVDAEVRTRAAVWLQGVRVPPMMGFNTSDIDEMSLWAPVLVSFAVAILTGLMGVGGGFIMFPILVYVLGVPTRVAVGTSAFRILFSTGAGTVS
ncbi:MAG: sulfite exporter TauE/SafE family protein, partial [Planctomycetes bacterium]|nr:sulfite exporter TauE/SafE family protein [Planctomycetota bacterium]